MEAIRLAEWDPDEEAVDFIESMIDKMSRHNRESMTDPLFPSMHTLMIDAVWPAVLVSSSTPRAGLGSSLKLQELLMRLSNATARFLFFCWQEGFKVFMTCQQTPTAVVLALMQGLREAQLLREDWVPQSSWSMIFMLDITEWSNDEPTQRPACCVLQNLVDAQQSGFVIINQNTSIQLCNDKRAVDAPGRMELERLALRLLAALPPRCLHISGLHLVSVEELGHEIDVILYLPFMLGDPLMSSDWSKVGRAGREMLVEIEDSDGMEVLVCMLESAQPDSTFKKLGLNMRCVSTGLTANDKSFLERLARACCSLKGVDVALKLQVAPPVHVEHVLALCLNLGGRPSGVPWFQKLTLELLSFRTQVVLEQLTSPGLESCLLHLAGVQIENLAFRSDSLQADVTAMLHEAVERMLAHNLYVKECSQEYDDAGMVTCAVNLRTPRLRRNRKLPAQIAVLKQLTRSQSNPMWQKVVSKAYGGSANFSFQLLQHLLPIDAPIAVAVRQMCGCKPAHEGDGSLRGSPAVTASVEHEPAQQDLAAIGSGESSFSGPTGAGSSQQQPAPATPAEELQPSSAIAEASMSPQQPSGLSTEDEGSGSVGSASPAEATLAAQVAATDDERQIMMEEQKLAANLDLAIQASETSKLSDDTKKALSLSKRGPVMLEFEGYRLELGHPPQVRFELSKVGGSAREKVHAVIMHDPELQPQRDRVFAFGCEIAPAWAGGAFLLLPVTEASFLVNIDTHPEELKHYIFGFAEDFIPLSQALQRISPNGARRPRLRAPKALLASLSAEQADQTSAAASQEQPAEAPHTEGLPNRLAVPPAFAAQDHDAAQAEVVEQGGLKWRVKNTFIELVDDDDAVDDDAFERRSLPGSLP